MTGSWYPIPLRARLPVLLVTAPLATALALLMQGHLNLPGTPWGIVDLELAGTTLRAREILRLWDEQGMRAFASVSLAVDLPFIVAYSTGLGVACAIGADGQPARRWFLVGAALAWGQWFAGLLDLSENGALAAMLSGAVEQPWPLAAKIFASLKFALILSGLLYVVASSGRWLYRRFAPAP